MLATSTDSKVYLWILNCNWETTIGASIVIIGRNVSSALGVRLKHDGMHAQGWKDEDPPALVSNSPASVSNNAVSITLQPYSLTLLEVS